MAESEESKFYNNLGARIRSARTAANMTQEELGGALDLSRFSIVNMEKGRQHPSLFCIYQMSIILRVDLIELLPPTTLPRLINPELKKIASDNPFSNENVVQFIYQIPIHNLSNRE